MNYFRKISLQTAWQILGKIVTSFSTFIILGLVARNYGQEGTGIFTLALTYLAIFYMLADFGFNAHEIKKDKIEWQKLLGTRILWALILVILAVGLLPFWPFSTHDFSKAVLFGSLAIVASSVYVTCNLLFQKNLKYQYSVLASSIGTIFSLGFFIFLVNSNYSVPYLVIGHLSGWIIIALTALFFIKTKIFLIFDFRYALKLFKDSWPIAATLSLNILYFRADSFLIAYYRSIADVGIYNIAYSVFQSALVLPTFIMNAYYPLMIKSFNKVKLVAIGLLGLAFLGTVTTFFLAPSVVKILTGKGFEGSVQSLQILSLGLPAYFLSSLLMWIMIAKNKYKSMLAIYTSGLIFNVVLNLIFIPGFSFIAASWITVISEYLILILQVFVLKKYNFKI